MTATDELRSYAHQRLFDGSEKYDQHILYFADMIEEELANYIELPKDADGETIRIGDELETYHYEDGTVAGIQYYETGRTLIAVRPHGWDTPTWQDPESYTHAKPDSWERIIRDAQGDGILNQIDGRPSDFEALVERCKKLAGEE